ncbi:MAG: methylenetetrahydrofolate reductase [Actinomycetota bacterium]|nr:methylenetetrahydrofolate reductase [Actinomycetota bacterium]
MDQGQARRTPAGQAGTDEGSERAPLATPASFRFEVMPTEGAVEQTAYLPEGAKVAVSCSPAKGVEGTLALGEELSRRGFRVVPHVSARPVKGRAHLGEILRRLGGAGVRDVFVVGGDAKEPAGLYADAPALLRAMGDLGHGFEQVGVTGYPEGHPAIVDDALRRALRDKLPFATYIVTQMCFDPEVILGWVAGIRREGIGLPVYVGIPGVVERRKLLRISLRIGVGDSARFLAKHANIVASLLKPGYSPDALVERLVPYAGDREYNIAGFHVYTFNQVENTEKWLRQTPSLSGAAVG